jgi:DNA transposition AAA+ family ATPase
MRTKLVATANVRALAKASEEITSRAPSRSRIAIVHGAAGMGKTTAIVACANAVDGICIEAHPLWTPAWMLSDFVREMGGDPARSSQSNYQWIVGRLREEPRAFFLDEADRLTTREVLVESLRAIHDGTGSSFFLVGMDKFRRRATARPQLSRRVAVEVEFQKVTRDDALLLAKELVEVEVADECIFEVHQNTGGNLSRFLNELSVLENNARKAGARRVGGELRAA